MHYSLIIIISFNVIYQTLARLLPKNTNPYKVQIYMYASALVIALLAYFIKGEKTVRDSTHILIYLAMGASIFMLELGYIIANRERVSASKITLVSSIFIVISLIIINYLIFNEQLNLRTVIGLAFGFVSLYFLI